MTLYQADKRTQHKSSCLLGAGFNIQIMATFNTSLKNLDPALMRKGRLKLSYEFKN